MSELLIATLAVGAFFAGFVDAVVGGGGLIQVPLLFSALPQHPPATLFGTNKIASIVGTGSAALQYLRRVRIPVHLAASGALAALLGAWFGARSVAYLDPELVRPIVLLLLVGVAAHTFASRSFGQDVRDVAPHLARRRIAAIGLVVGFYDGFFGPGTGSFFIFLLIRFVGMDFLRASATAKILNFSTNLAAIAYFGGTGSVLWQTGLLMAACNVAGALTGSHLALKHGTGFVRALFLFVVCALIARMAWELFVA